MPRTARVSSESGIYHIMLRGINGQQIFFDDEDSYFFIKLLSKYKNVSGYKLYAFCLMGNHVHILIHAQNEPIGLIIQRIGSTFAYWYNTKYERTGHVFQDRFRSEPINDERYLFTALRYILLNPVKAGFCSTPEAYKYSSGREYIDSAEGITDTEFITSLIDKNSLKEFISQKNDDQCMDIGDGRKIRVTDTTAAELIINEFGTLSPPVDKPKDRATLNEAIRKLSRNGISIRQLSRLTGISKKVIEMAIKQQ